MCAGDGHTEAIKITYDPKKVSYDELLDVFFQGCNADSKGKAQYKSAVWVSNDEQRLAAEAQKLARGKANLEIIEENKWHDAEEYHQKYYEKQCCVQ